MNKSEEINELAGAMAKAQATIHNPGKKADNPFFKSKYADLAEVLGVIREVFPDNGLSIIQTPFTSEGGNIGVTTLIAHSSGQWLEDSVELPVQGKNIAQDAGSTITYLRRYSAAAAAGIAQEDVDANLKADNAGNVTNLKEKPVISLTQLETLRQMIKETDTDEGAFTQYLKVEKLQNLAPAGFDVAMNALEKKQAAQEKAHAD